MGSARAANRRGRRPTAAGSRRGLVGRRRAAIALAATDPEFAQTFAFECLGDCESETRAVGCEAVPLDDRSIPRLQAIADDPVEDATTRTAATLRLRTLDQQ